MTKEETKRWEKAVDEAHEHARFFDNLWLEQI